MTRRTARLELGSAVRASIETSWVDDASPSPGVPMTSKVRTLLGPLQGFAKHLAHELQGNHESFVQVFAPRIDGLGFSDSVDIGQRIAWAAIGSWLSGYALGALQSTSTLSEAESWFYGTNSSDLPSFSRLDLRLPESIQRASPRQVFALLPYLLDPLATGTRRSVQRDSSEHGARTARKHAGVFYTPADVAQFMASRAHTPPNATVFDPAVGTGVFLRAVCHVSGETVRTFGTDVDPLAVEAAAFVLLTTSTRDSVDSPWAKWHLLRLNLATKDSLLLQPGGPSAEKIARRHKFATAIRQRLGRNELTPGLNSNEPASDFIGELFPELAGGADVVLTNPPYAPLGSGYNADVMKHSFTSLLKEVRLSPRLNVYPFFLEQASRLLEPERGQACVVVPLSIAFSTDPLVRSARRMFSRSAGGWQFFFFDRAPDALFGDDVKTRNAIVVHQRGRRQVQTTSLVRWTSRTRRELFDHLTPVSAEIEIEQFIPKLGSRHEVDLYKALRLLPVMNESLLSLAKEEGERLAPSLFGGSIHVGTTAYNWLNCVRDKSALSTHGHNSETPFIQLVVRDEEMADALYAALASHVTYWLWRVEGDGFHVNGGFLRRLPYALHRARGPLLSSLARAGRDLWEATRLHPSISSNKGRRSVGFSPTMHAEPVSEIDSLLLKAIGGSYPAKFELRAWYEGTVLVDDSDQTRAARLRLE